MAVVDGADDLAAVDALEVGARDAEVGVAELALYDDEDRDGRLLVTVPETVEATVEDLTPALQSA